jgi:hypothetical protein
VQNEGFGIKADLCFVEDTDGEGTPDYLDNDSDGDGCSDAFEAGAISTPGGPTQKLTGDVGTNGLVNTIETNDSETAMVTYASTAFMAYSPVSSCADTDGDGIPDRDDLDDDNDGITDYVEYDCGIGTFVKSYIVTAGLGMSIGGTFNNGNYKGSGTFTFSNLSALNSVTDAGDYGNYKLNDANKEYGMKALLVPTNGILSSFEFGPNLSNTANASTVNGQQSITVSWNLPVGGIVHDPDDQLSSHADGQGINPGGILVTKADYTVAESTWKIVVPLPYVNTAINFSANVAGVANLGEESFGIGLYVCNKKPDLDGDGKVNAVDLDSDGDGCSDFVEAKSFQWTSLTDQTIAGPFGVNGLSSLVESDDTRSASLNYTVSNNYLDPLHAGCIDDDGDGGASVDDIDDDNDGILDQTECPTEPAVSKFGFVRANPLGTQMFITNKITGANLGLITIKAIKNIVVDDLIGNENDNSVGGHWFYLER